MLKKRIIPTLLVKSTGLYKGKNFISNRNVGALMPSIKTYNMRDVDEIVILDIEATDRKTETDLNLLRDISENCFVPITFGGGINNVKQVKQLFRYGADKVVVNSYLYSNINFVSNIVDEFGSQSIVASVDVKRFEKKWICYSNNGRLNTNNEVLEWCTKLQDQGVGEIILCSIDQDGLLQGYDQELIKYVSNNINIPLIASGGASSFEDFKIAIQNGASAVAAASMFHFTYRTPNEAKEFLLNKGIPIRQPLKS
jgi:cyclase